MALNLSFQRVLFLPALLGSWGHDKCIPSFNGCLVYYPRSGTGFQKIILIWSLPLSKLRVAGLGFGNSSCVKQYNVADLGRGMGSPIPTTGTTSHISGHVFPLKPTHGSQLPQEEVQTYQPHSQAFHDLAPACLLLL